jgi:hypothetical protein
VRILLWKAQGAAGDVRGARGAPAGAAATGRSLREIANELATMGYKNKNGAPYSASCVKSMVEPAYGHRAREQQWPTFAGLQLVST